jgi:hypothetical protein
MRRQSTEFWRAHREARLIICAYKHENLGDILMQADTKLICTELSNITNGPIWNITT